jgi:hypothetical protein
MKRIIKLTEAQIREVGNDGFNYLNGGDIPNYNGQTHISATGKLNQEEYGNPTTTDDVANKLSNQPYNLQSIGTRTYRQRTNEDGSQTDMNNGQMPNLPNLDSNGDGNIPTNASDIEKNEDNITIPMAINTKLELLSKALNTTKLTPKQKGIILNKIVDLMPLNNVPYSWKKELITKIKQ